MTGEGDISRTPPAAGRRTDHHTPPAAVRRTVSGGGPRAVRGLGRLTFRRRHRLTHDLEFKAVFGFSFKKHQGPITLHLRPSDRRTHTPTHRLGLSVPRRVGNAVERNAIKRRLREAFRLCHADWPTLTAAAGPDSGPGAGLDVVVSVRPHARLSTGQYAALLTAGVRAACRDLARRASGRAPSERAP